MNLPTSPFASAQGELNNLIFILKIYITSQSRMWFTLKIFEGLSVNRIYHTKKLALRSETTKGFTLIELLIAISVIGILAAITIPQLTAFNRRQVLKNTTSEAKNNLRYAQNKAVASEIDTTQCTQTYTAGNKLLGWYAYFPNGSGSYYISGRCADAAPLSKDFSQKNFNLPQGLRFTSNAVYILFSPTGGGAVFYNDKPPDGQISPQPTSRTLTITNQASENKSVVITQTGEIYVQQ